MCLVAVVLVHVPWRSIAPESTLPDTTGGFHSSALKVIRKMAESLDPACCLLSRAEWKRMLMEHIAIAVQRGNADIMIQASQRSREALLGRPVRAKLGPEPRPPA